MAVHAVVDALVMQMVMGSTLGWEEGRPKGIVPKRRMPYKGIVETAGRCTSGHHHKRSVMYQSCISHMVVESCYGLRMSCIYFDGSLTEVEVHSLTVRLLR